MSTVIKVLISATVLFLVILVIRKGLRERVGNGFIYFLWLIFAVDLLVSGAYLAGQDVFGWDLYPIQSPVSVMNLADVFLKESRQDVPSSNDAENTVGQTGNEGENTNKNSGEKNTKETAAVSDEKKSASGQGEENSIAGATKRPEGISVKWDWRKAVFGIWMAGAVLLFILQILLERRLRRQLVENRQEREYQGQKFYITKGISTPLLFRSRGISLDIYIPEMIMDDENVVKHAILHENTHKRHGDIWWSYVRNILVALYWFYPPVWIAAVLSKRDCELACDSSLMRGMNQKEKISYGNSLLSLVEVGKKENVFSTATAMKIGKSEMEVRIHMIKKGIQKKKLAVLLVCVLLCGAGIVAYTDADNTSGEVRDSNVRGGKDVKRAEEKEGGTEEDLPGNAVPVKEAEYKITDLWGADSPQIYYEDDATMIFAGYFGLFVYSKQEERIVQSLDLKYIGCDSTQGDHYCDIRVSEDGTQVYLHVNNEDTMFQYFVDTNKLRHVKYELPEKLYVYDANSSYNAKEDGGTNEEGVSPERGAIRYISATIGDLLYQYEEGEVVKKVPLFYTPYAPYKDCKFFGPEDIHDIQKVSFYMCGKEYVVEDEEKLKWIEEHFSEPSEEIIGGSGCPFCNVMYLKRKDGTVGKIYPALDSCVIYATWGVGKDEYSYYEYDEGSNEEFWKLFGIESIDRASVGE